MSKFKNDVHLEGYLWEVNLEQKVTGASSKNPNTEYIRGSISIAVDDEALNVIPVYFIYVTKMLKNGSANDTYKVLSDLINTEDTYKKVGTNAIKLRVDGSAAVNDFVSRDGSMVENRRVQGSFCHLVNGDFSDNRDSFRMDAILTNCMLIEADDTNSEEYLVIKGYTANFMNDLIPISVSVKDKNGIDYFTNLINSNHEPVKTDIWGTIICTTVQTKNEDDDNQVAWGAAAVKTSTRTFRTWELTGSAQNYITINDENEDYLLTKAGFEQALAAREMNLESIKKRNEEYQQNRQGFPASSNTNTSSQSPTASQNYKF